MSDQREGPYKVSDRRKFNADGTPKDPQPDEAPRPLPELREDPAPATAPVPAPAQAREPDRPDAQPRAAGGSNIVSFPGEGPRKREQAPGAASAQAAARQTANAGVAQAYDTASTNRELRMPAASFLSLANMLGVEAAMHLGLIEAAPGAGKSIDLDAARHVVDLLGILQDKTHGNLTDEEETLLDNMLADLRMQFVAASRSR